MDDARREARILDTGYWLGFSDASEGRPNRLAVDYALPVPGVIDLHEWRVQHGRCACEARRTAEQN